jgi:hypothetical protein
MTGIDATVELVAELDRLCESQPLAVEAPGGKELYRYLFDGLSPRAPVGAVLPDDFAALTGHLLARLGIWWSPAAYWRLPIMTPWCVRDRSCRYDHGPESWGAPREGGYLRDDNSIIKKLAVAVSLTAPSGHPYAGRKPWRGFTACHIWRELPHGSVAGEDPWLTPSCRTSSGCRRGLRPLPTGANPASKDCSSGPASRSSTLRPCRPSSLPTQ